MGGGLPHPLLIMWDLADLLCTSSSSSSSSET